MTIVNKKLKMLLKNKQCVSNSKARKMSMFTLPKCRKPLKAESDILPFYWTTRTAFRRPISRRCRC